MTIKYVACGFHGCTRPTDWTYVAGGHFDSSGARTGYVTVRLCRQHFEADLSEAETHCVTSACGNLATTLIRLKMHRAPGGPLPVCRTCAVQIEDADMKAVRAEHSATWFKS